MTPTLPSASPRTGLLLRGAGLVVALVGAYVAVSSFDLRSVLAALERVDPIWLLPAVAVVAAQLLLRAARLRTLLARPANDRPIGIPSIATAMLVAFVVNAVSPARVGDGVKCYLVSRQQRVPFTRILGVLMLEHGLDSASLAIVAAVIATILDITGPLRTVALISGLAGVIALAVIFTIDAAHLPRRVRQGASAGATGSMVGRVFEGLAHFGAGFAIAGRRRVAAVALAIGLLAWFCDGLMFWLVAQSLGLSLSAPGAMLIAAAVALSTVLPGAPGYVGTLELAAVTAAATVGLVGPGALALALVFHLVTYVPLSVAGLLVVALGGAVPAPAGQPVASSRAPRMLRLDRPLVRARDVAVAHGAAVSRILEPVPVESDR